MSDTIPAVSDDDLRLVLPELLGMELAELPSARRFPTENRRAAWLEWEVGGVAASYAPASSGEFMRLTPAEAADGREIMGRSRILISRMARRIDFLCREALDGGIPSAGAPAPTAGGLAGRFVFLYPGAVMEWSPGPYLYLKPPQNAPVSPPEPAWELHCGFTGGPTLEPVVEPESVNA